FESAPEPLELRCKGDHVRDPDGIIAVVKAADQLLKIVVRTSRPGCRGRLGGRDRVTIERLGVRSVGVEYGAPGIFAEKKAAGMFFAGFHVAPRTSDVGEEVAARQRRKHLVEEGFRLVVVHALVLKWRGLGEAAAAYNLLSPRPCARTLTGLAHWWRG